LLQSGWDREHCFRVLLQALLSRPASLSQRQEFPVPDMTLTKTEIIREGTHDSTMFAMGRYSRLIYYRTRSHVKVRISLPGGLCVVRTNFSVSP
jgi:hypothetical protein